MKTPGGYHVPVLLAESIGALEINPDGIYVDCTFGGGGHSSEILKRLSSKGRLIGFDQDREAGKNVPADSRITFVPNNFRHLQRFLRLHGAVPANGILADLGVSSYQIDTPGRGFSTRFDGLLDMRMDERGNITAADVLNRYSPADLQLMFQNYGEVTNAKTLAAAIAEARSKRPFRMLSDLNTILRELMKGNPQRYFSQVYQAIRIEVNDEMNALADMLRQAAGVLAPEGRIAVITFHSVEDRIVKNFFRFGNEEGIRHTDEFGQSEQLMLKPVFKKPVRPAENERKTNPRSRSAKLRVAEKIKS